MSSTDREVVGILRGWYRDRLAPLAKRLHARRAALLPSEGPGESYYVEADIAASELVEFGGDDFQRALSSSCKAAGLEELEEIVGPAVELGRRLHREAEESPDVSPLIYVMF